MKMDFQDQKKRNGTVDRYKARLVAKGLSQKVGFDYLDIFSPAAKQTTVRVILCLALYFNWTLQQVDVNIAFLNENLLEEVYMS